MANLLERLRSPAGILLLGKVANTASQALILVLVGRQLGAGAVGLYTLGLALVSPIFLLANMQVQDVLGVDEAAATRWSEHVAALLSVGGVAAAVCIFVAWLMPTNGLFGAVVALVLVKAVQSVMFACHGIWLGVGTFTAVATSLLVRACTQLIALYIGLSLGGLMAGILGMAIVSLMALLFLDLPRAPRFSVGEVRPVPIARLSLSLAPLGFGAFLISANQSVVRFLLEGSAGVVALGVFAATAYLVRLGSVAAQSIGASAAPQFRVALATNNSTLYLRQSLKVAASAAAVGCLLLIGGFWFGPDLIQAVYGPEFRPSRWLVVAVFAAGVPLFASTALAIPAVGVGHRRRYLSTSAVGLALTAIAAFILVPDGGIYGAAYAWTIGEVARLFGLLWHVLLGRVSIEKNAPYSGVKGIA